MTHFEKAANILRSPRFKIIARNMLGVGDFGDWRVVLPVEWAELIRRSTAQNETRNLTVVPLTVTVMAMKMEEQNMVKRWLLPSALFISVLFSAIPEQALAWGGRGHHLICEASAYLVKEPGLKQFLTARPQVLGHLCNIPDIYWRSLGAKTNELGSPTHFINVEVIGLKLSEVPADFPAVIAKYEGQPNLYKPGTKIKSIPSQLGSIWWRTDQFYRGAVEAGKAAKAAQPPKGREEQQNEQLPYNQAAFTFMVNLGVMGHFVGDDSQPFHNTADYDGYGAGHGGIHSYFEDQGVDAEAVDLVVRVKNKADKLRASKPVPGYLMAKSPIEKMRALSIISAQDISRILRLDPMIKPSHVDVVGEKEIKTPAERKPIATVVAKFDPLLVSELARAAALLSQLWDEAYIAAGKPDLSEYKSYRYPLTPEFIEPNYFGSAQPK